MDRGASAGFESIAEMLLQQKKLMDALEAENRELRRQLAELRRGVGIAVVIEGKTVQLATGAVDPSYQNGLGGLMPSSTSSQLNQLNSQINQLGLGPASGPFPGTNTPGSLPVPSMPMLTPDKPAGNGNGSNNGRNPLADSFVL